MSAVISHHPVFVAKNQAPVKLTQRKEDYVEFLERQIQHRNQRINELEQQLEQTNDDATGWFFTAIICASLLFFVVLNPV